MCSTEVAGRQPAMELDPASRDASGRDGQLLPRFVILSASEESTTPAAGRVPMDSSLIPFPQLFMTLLSGAPKWSSARL